MRIILDQTEKNYLNQIACEYDLRSEGLFMLLNRCLASNFEQDLIDLAKEEQDWLRKDYGSYDPDKKL